MKSVRSAQISAARAAKNAASIRLTIANAAPKFVSVAQANASAWDPWEKDSDQN
jgi:hypothetical protein